MIFVVAAYTITLGVLALYGVLLQHRERILVREVGGCRDSDGGVTGSFNIGAMLLAPFWMWSHGMRIPGAVLLGLWAGLAWLALGGIQGDMADVAFLLVSMVLLAAGAALGMVGNRIAASHRGNESSTAFFASQLPWAIAGVLVYTILLPWLWYFRTAA